MDEKSGVTPAAEAVDASKKKPVARAR